MPNRSKFQGDIGPLRSQGWRRSRIGRGALWREIAGRCGGNGAGLHWAAHAAIGLALACGGTDTRPNAPGAVHGERRDTRLVHEPCEVEMGDVEAQDVNDDGRADLTVIRSGASELCRFLDLDFDGKVDVWIYKDQGGAVRRRESDFDRDGRIDEITLLRAGQVMEKHRSTSLRGAIDTWNYFEGGRLVRTVRDSDGDSVIDQWWEYDKAGKPDCPVVHSDVDHDGRPDPGASVDLCSAESLAPRSDDEEEEAESRLPEPDRAPVEVESEEDAEAAPSSQTPAKKTSTGAAPAPAASGGKASDAP